MDEIENYSESIHEQSNEHAHHLVEEGKEKWVLWVALSTAVIAVLAAITGLLAGNNADEAMLAQIRSSDQWAFYQAKGLKADMLNTENHLLTALGKPVDTTNAKHVQKERAEQQEIMGKAKEEKLESDEHSAKHDVFARGVTLFQVAIAIGAISIITKRKGLWLASLCFAGVGVFFLLQGLIV